MRRWLSAFTLIASLILHAGSALAWSFVQAGSAGTSDGAGAVMIDSHGDVISSGFLHNPAPEYVLVKHSGANGSELWRVPLSGARVIETGNGEIVVAGRSDPSGSHVVKLSADGSQVWRVDLPGVYLDAAERSGTGDLVAVGSVATTPQDSDVFAIALDDGGGERWRRTISGISAGEAAGSVRFDGNGDVIFAGSFGHNAALGFNDFAVFKLAGPDGSELWRAIVPSNAGHGGNAYSVAVDSVGDVVAVGSAVLVDWCDAVVVKLNGTNGSEAWRTVIDEPGTGSCDYLSAVALNDEGDVFSTGAPKTIEFSVFKFSGTSGVQAWRHDIPNLASPTGGECCGGKAIGVRPDGSVVAMGIRLGPDGPGQIAVARLDPTDGHELFIRIIDSDRCGDGYPAMALGPDGDIAIAASLFFRTGGACVWPHGYDYGVLKLTGASGLDFWGGCQDERDNDQDGLVDFPLDPGCASARANVEAPACNNGVDDDGDGLVDLADPLCTVAWRHSESPPPGCGVGPELAFLVLLLRRLRGRSAPGTSDESISP